MVESMLDIVNRITVIMEEMDCPAMVSAVYGVFKILCPALGKKIWIEYGVAAF